MNEESNLFAEIAQQDKRRAQWAESKRRKRAEKRKAGEGVFHIQIELTQAEMLELDDLQRQARDPFNFRKLALLQGARFRANSGAGTKPGRRKPQP